MYLDSYGRPPKKEFQKFIEINSKSIQINAKQHQSKDSDVCGQYCICYLSKRVINPKMYEILSIFNENKRKENDLYVLNYIHNKFNC